MSYRKDLDVLTKILQLYSVNWLPAGSVDFHVVHCGDIEIWYHRKGETAEYWSIDPDDIGWVVDNYSLLQSLGVSEIDMALQSYGFRSARQSVRETVKRLVNNVRT